VPLPVVETRVSSPPCARVNSRAIAKPSPLPPGRAEPKNGRNKLSCAFGGSPGPSSAMSIAITPFSRTIDRVEEAWCNAARFGRGTDGKTVGDESRRR